MSHDASYPPPPGTQPPAGPPAGAVESNLTLNLWLSVFFFWIPALIFYVVEKGKVPAPVHAANAGNLNFQLVRTIAIVAASIVSWIPVLGQIIFFVVAVGLAVISILHAVQVPGRVAQALKPNYILTPNWVS